MGRASFNHGEYYTTIVNVRLLAWACRTATIVVFGYLIGRNDGIAHLLADVTHAAGTVRDHDSVRLAGHADFLKGIEVLGH